MDVVFGQLNIYHNVVMSRQSRNSSSGLRTVQQVKRGQYTCPLAGAVIRGSDRPPHEVGGEQHPRQRHHPHADFKLLARNNDGGYTGVFQEPGNVSHGHVAHRSDGHQDNSFHPGGGKFGRPGRTGLFEQARLGARPDK